MQQKFKSIKKFYFILLYIQHTLIFQQDIMQKQPQHAVFQTLKQLINFKVYNGHNSLGQRKLIEQVKAYSDKDQIFYQSIQEKLKIYFEKNWNFLLKVCKSLDNVLRKSMLKQVKIIDSLWKTSYEAILTNIPQISLIQIIKKIQEKVEEKQKKNEKNQLNLKDYKNSFREIAIQSKFLYKDFEAFIQYIENFEQLYETVSNQNPRNDMYEEQEELLNQFMNNIQKCPKDADISKKELEQTSYSQNIQKSYFQKVHFEKSSVGSSSSSNIFGMNDMLSEIQKKEQIYQNRAQNYTGFQNVDKNRVDNSQYYQNSNTYNNDYTSGKVKPSQNRTIHDESVTNSKNVVVNKTFNNKF